MKIDNAIKEYIISLNFAEGRSDNTIDSYQRDLKIYESFLNENNINDIEKIDDLLIDRFVSQINKKYSSASVNRMKTSIRNLHRFLNFKYDISDPTINLTVSKGEKRLPIYATIEDVYDNERVVVLVDTEQDAVVITHLIGSERVAARRAERQHVAL